VDFQTLLLFKLRVDQEFLINLENLKTEKKKVKDI